MNPFGESGLRPDLSNHLTFLGVLLFYEFVSLIVFMIINVHVATVLLVMA